MSDFIDIIHTKNCVEFIFLENEISFGNVHNYKDIMKEILNDDKIKEVVLNLENLYYLDSSAIGLCFELFNRRRKSKKIIIRLKNVREIVKNLFTLIGLDKLNIENVIEDIDSE